MTRFLTEVTLSRLCRYPTVALSPNAVKCIVFLADGVADGH
jgi:hypothetical protein